MNEEQQVTATKVPVEQRLDMLPKFFQGHYMALESQVYYYMDKLCESYNGGFWEFYELNNGGFFMALDSKEKVKVEWEGSYFRESMTLNAVSITAYLFALNHLIFRNSDDQWLVKIYTKVIEYVYTHPESELIFSALD